MGRYVSFAAVKSQARFEVVLPLYSVTQLRQHGKRLSGPCPIHGGHKSEHFHVDLEKQRYNCFSCGAGGDILHFVATMESISVRDAAILLEDRLRLPRGAEHSGSDRHGDEQQRFAKLPNPPLKFRLTVDYDDSYLVKRGLDSHTVQVFGVGLSTVGSQRGRIVIPITNADLEPVAYVSRAIDDSLPKYRFPKGFRKSLELFHFWESVRRLPTIDDLRKRIILVEGFFGCMHVCQANFRVVAALMGCTLSPEQEHILLSHFQKVVLMMDGDEAGRRATKQISAQLKGKCELDVIELPLGAQPDNLKYKDFLRLLLPLQCPEEFGY